MTKKDYEMIAKIFFLQIAKIEILECNYGRSQVVELAKKLADSFEKDNPKFQRVKFLEACGVEIPEGKCLCGCGMTRHGLR